MREDGEMTTVATESGDAVSPPWEKVLDEREDELTLLPQQLRTVPSLELSRVNPPTYDGSEDIADLTYLNEASVVHNLKTRYSRGDIYVSWIEAGGVDQGGELIPGSYRRTLAFSWSQ